MGAVSLPSLHRWAGPSGPS